MVREEESVLLKPPDYSQVGHSQLGNYRHAATTFVLLCNRFSRSHTSNVLLSAYPGVKARSTPLRSTSFRSPFSFTWSPCFWSPIDFYLQLITTQITFPKYKSDHLTIVFKTLGHTRARKEAKMK